MDLMAIRRGLMAMGNRVRMVSGEFIADENIGAYFQVTHNLGTRKLFGVAQRVNSDHTNINNSSS